MKILFNKKQILRIINEQISSAADVSSTKKSIESLVNKQRNVGWAVSPTQDDVDNINDNEINTIPVPSNPHQAYIIYLDGYEREAEELKNIAEKYKGFLSPDATDDETVRIGRLLSYPENEIEDYIKKRNYNETI